MKTNILLETGTNELEIVEFKLKYTDKKSKSKKTQSYGVNVAKVREIIQMPKLTLIPNLPDMVYGVFNLRGRIIPALDLTKFLYGEENKEKERKMVIAEFNKVRVGFIVHDVYRIHRISWNQIISPDTMQQYDPEQSTIIGIIKFDDRNIMMLDVEKIVADIDPTSAIEGQKEDEKQKFTTKPIAVTAEDSVVIRKMITSRLNKAGFEIKAFNDGLAAWEYLNELSQKVNKGENLDNHVNVVITDIEMPKMDGYSLTKRIKSDENLSQLPVVIFSSIISEDILHKGKSVGADAQLTKPQIGELLDALRYILQGKPVAEF